ncbi:MAG: ABC transporter permease, partial [Coprobacillus sp.]
VKNIIFGLFGILIPFLLLVQLFIKAVNEGYMNSQLATLLIIFYIVVYLGLVIYIMIKERNSQKEVTDHVKYLNRGQ